MEIIDLSTPDYLQGSLHYAAMRGYEWIMVLLARKRDTQKSYNDLLENWDSYHDITGKKILFLFSFSAGAHTGFVPANDYFKSASKIDFEEQKKEAIDNNTRFVSLLRDRYGISEKDIPSILVFSTMERNPEPIFIPIKSDDLYKTIKGLIIATETLFKSLVDIENECEKMDLQKKDINEGLRKNALSIDELKFAESQIYLFHAMMEHSSAIDINLLQKALKHRNTIKCESFPRPVLYYMDKIIKGKQLCPNTAISIENKYTLENTLRRELEKIAESQNKNRESMKRIRNDIEEAMRQYAASIMDEDIKSKHVETATEEKCESYTYKIGVTFTGKNRNNVKEICETLIKYHDFSRDDIFYDNWHKSKIAGISADDVLQDIYSRQCECIVVFLSDDYMKKPWTGEVEWESIKTLIHSNKKRRILLFNTDSIDIDSINGLNSKRDIFIKTNEMNTDNIALTIYEFYRDRSSKLSNTTKEKKEEDKSFEMPAEATTLRLTYLDYFHRAVNEEKQGNLDQAIIEWTNAIKKNPHSSHAYNNRGLCYSQLKQYTEMLSDYKKAIELDPKNHATLTNLADYYDKEGRQDEAIHTYIQAIAAKPDYEISHNNLGNVYFNKSQYQEAIEEYKKSIQANPMYVLAYLNLGNTYYKTHEYEKAIDILTKAIKRDPYCADAYRQRADAYFAVGEDEKAEEDMAKVAELAKKH